MTNAFMNIAIRKRDDLHGRVQGGERQCAAVVRDYTCGRWGVRSRYRECLSSTWACFDCASLHADHLAGPAAVTVHRVCERETEIVGPRAVDVRRDSDPHR